MAAVTVAPSGTISQRLLLTAATTLTISPGFDGQVFSILFQQDGTGGRVVTPVSIAGFQQPNQSANAVSVQTFVCDLLNNVWRAVDVEESLYGTSAATPVAIPNTTGLYELTGNVVTYTLAAPVAGGPGTGQDFQILYISNTVAHANVITITGLTHGTTATFGTTAVSALSLMAYNAKWYVVGSYDVTMS